MTLYKVTDAGPVALRHDDDVLLPGDTFVLVQHEGDDQAAIDAVLMALMALMDAETEEQR